jgi:hypothetical protein
MSLSGGAKVLSALVVLVLLAVPVLVWSTMGHALVGGPRGPAAPWVQLLVQAGVGLAPLVGLASWALGPRAIELTGGELRVLRRAWRGAGYPLAEVTEVALLPPRWLLGAVRTFGNGGLFGWYGWYWKKGPFRLYATRTDRLVEVVVGGRRIVLSPDDPERLVEGILGSAPRARRRQPDDAGAASASTRS